MSKDKKTNSLNFRDNCRRRQFQGRGDGSKKLKIADRTAMLRRTVRAWRRTSARKRDYVTFEAGVANFLEDEAEGPGLGGGWESACNASWPGNTGGARFVAGYHVAW